MRFLILFMLALILISGCASSPHRPPIAAIPQDHSQNTITPFAMPVEKGLEIGRSVDGRPIILRLFGTGPKTVFVIGAIHGNEANSAVLCEKLIEAMRVERAWTTGQRVAVIASANPDGLGLKLRTNRNLVDLNRNFPASNWAKTRRGGFFGGDKPADQPETTAILRAFEELNPCLVISVHAMSSGPCNNYDGPAESYAKILAQRNGYPVRASIGYPTPGSLGTWAGVDRKLPMITLELPFKQPGDTCWKDNRQGLLEAITAAGLLENN